MNWTTIVQASVQLCGGIWCLLFGFGYVQRSKLGVADTLRRRFWWRVAGMVLILLAVMQVLDTTIQSRHPRNRNSPSTSTAEKSATVPDGATGFATASATHSAGSSLTSTSTNDQGAAK